MNGTLGTKVGRRFVDDGIRKLGAGFEHTF
jgi:hypothetical protein